MKTTARARIEQAVHKAGFMPRGKVLKLILAERARLRRGVRKQQQDAIAMSNDSKWWDGYIAATRDILALWET